MGNIRHKWMVLVVVVVTTFATAQEAVKQYDGLREQANEWATSRLLASLLNTSAPGEELIETQTVSSSAICSAEGIREEQPARQQPATLATYHVIETKSAGAPQLDEATHIAVNDETPATFDTQHFELSEADGESLARLDEVALLTDKNQFAELEALSQPEEAKEPEGAPDANDTEDDSIVHTQEALHFINRVITETPPRISETDISAIRARAAADARVQQRAARRALRVLQERTERPVKFEFKIIKKGDRTSGTATPLRAANSGSPSDAAAEDARCGLPAHLAFQDIAAASAQDASDGE
jgi:hypothetical protein